MSERIDAPHVGAPDPELNNSPIGEESDEAFESMMQSMSDAAMCYFNDKVYPVDAYVCSGDELLQCQQGVWLRKGTCDPDHSG